MRSSNDLDGQPRSRPYASPKLASWLANLTLVAGLLYGVIGFAQPINEATRAGAPVTVPVRLRNLAGVQAGSGRSAITLDKLATPNADPEKPEVQFQVPDAARPTWVPVPMELVLLRADGASRLELFLSEADKAAKGLCLMVGALLLSQLLRAVAAGRPFDPANPRRIATIGALVVAGGYMGQILPVVAGQLVLDRLGLSATTSPVYTDLALGLEPIIIAAFIFALAEAFRRGSLLARDVEGLV